MKKVNLILLAAAGAFLAYGFVGSQQGQNTPAKPRPAGTAKPAAAPAQKQSTQAAAPAQGQVGTQVGNVAPDLTFNNPEGKPVSLSSYRGKLVLLDFWASWCRPCRNENPNVVQAYNKYKDDKFTNGSSFSVLGVSLDTDKNNWMGAIASDQLTWSHISDLGGWNSVPAAMYGVRSIPSNFLIDGKGVIIAVNLRGPLLDEELEKYKVK